MRLNYKTAPNKKRLGMMMMEMRLRDETDGRESKCLFHETSPRKAQLWPPLLETDCTQGAHFIKGGFFQSNLFYLQVNYFNK
jgi:hypothetical protein